VNVADEWEAFCWAAENIDSDAEQKDGGRCGVFVLTAAHC